MISSDPRREATTLRELHRRLQATLSVPQPVEDAAPLELTRSLDGTHPHIAAAPSREDPEIRCRDVEGDVAPGFDAFLDGSQTSYVHHYADGVPVVVGSVGAVVRVRRERRMSTWRHASAVAVYVPLRALRPVTRDRLGSLGVVVRDTSDEVYDHDAVRDEVDGGGEAGDADSGDARHDEVVHPFAITDAAVHSVQRDRERLERELAVAWVTSDAAPLLLDGGIAGHPDLAAAGSAVGVVKSHHVIYGGPEAYRIIVSLCRGQRSSVVTIDSGHAKRSAVASWYLRLREDRKRDPFWGLVRVEVSFPGDGRLGELTRRADEVSRWILAEASPLSLPDSRWDRMVYGVRDCEEFLRAIRV